VCIDQAFVICAYCYMPDHAHFVVEGQLAHPVRDSKSNPRRIG
jgi:REP element-mobilizing transposase RayT